MFCHLLIVCNAINIAHILYGDPHSLYMEDRCAFMSRHVHFLVSCNPSFSTLHFLHSWTDDVVAGNDITLL